MRTAPLLWEPGAGVPALFAPAVTALAGRVGRAAVAGVFFSADATWGTPLGPKGWTHLSGSPPGVFADKLKTAGQTVAGRAEEFGMLCRALADYPLAAADQAARVLASDALTRSEKAQAVAGWFLALHRRVEGVRGPRRDNLVWAAVALAPPGFCRVRSTVLSTLLDDIVAGLEFGAVRARWAEKLHPLRYQRPTAAPTQGAIDAAGKLFETLGAAASLARRHARLSDVEAFLWRPPEEAPAPASAGGLFGHLRSGAAGVGAVELPPVRVTWEKFARAVLPGALGVEARVPQSGNFYGLLAATDPAAPAIFQWDGPPGRARNPASMCVYHGVPAAGRWGLVGDDWVEVTGAFRNPAHWQAPELVRHHGEQALFALRGAGEGAAESCLFPEFLRAEFRPVRSVIEAHSKRTAPAGAAGADANGVGFGRGEATPLGLRVRTAAGVAVYELDRWD